MSGFDARAYVRKKYGNKEEEEVNELTSSETESSDEGDGFDARTYITEKYRKLAASEFGLDTLESDLQSMGSTIGNIYNEWQSEETLANIKSSVEAIHGRLNQYQEYQKKYGGADLSDVLGGYQSILDDWDNLSSVYGQYRNADAFNTARKKTQMDTDFSGLSYDEVQSKLKEHEEDSDEYKYLSGYTNYSDLRDFDKALENMTEGDSKDKLQIARNQHALDNAFDSYKGYLEADDFDETSQYVSTIEDRKFLWMDDRYIGDEVYEYINNADGKIRSDLLSDYYAQQSQSQGVSLYAPSKFEEMGLDMLTDEEIGVYNTLYRTEGKEAAEKFLSDMKVTLNKRASEQTAAQMEKTVDDGVLSSIAMSAVSPILNVGGGIYSGIENLSSALKGEEVNPYSPYHSMTNMASDIRQSVGENIEENTNLSIGGQNVANFLYNTGMSVADSALGAFTLGKVYTPLMGMNAYQQKAKELKEAGASDHEVKLTALVSGVAEAAFEYVGIDNLFKIKNVDGWKNAISSVLKQMGTEGLEEIGTEVANVISEQLIRGKDSELVQMYNNLTALGYTEKEARTEMAKQIGSNVAWAGIGGALSGGVMGGAYSGAQYNDLSNTGKQIRSNDRVQEMADMFDMMDLQGLTPEQSEAYRLYGEYLQNGDIDNLSNAKLGNLYQTSEREAINTLQSKKATAAQKTDAANRLYRLGEISTSRSADEKARQQRVKELNTGEVTKINSTGNAVKIEGIRKEGDSTTVLTSEGEAKAEDMTFSSNDAEMLSYAEIMGSEKGSLFLSQYDGKQDVDAYRQSFNLAYAYGESGIGSETALKNKGVLTESQVSEIYKNAVTIKANTKQKAIDAINEQYGSKLVTKGSFDDSVIDYKNSTKDGSKVNWKSLTSTQKRAVTFAKAFSRATGVNIRFVKSEVVDGKHVGKNGSYNPNNNSIEIDVYAGRIDSKALNDSIIPTMSHEITHWMKAKAPAMFSKMQEAVMNTLALDDGMSMDDRIDREMMRMKNAHPDQDVTPEAAIDEIVARACEDMLSNSKKAREFLDGLSESEKKSFAYKVKKTYHNLMDWVNKLLGEYESGSEEAKILRAYEDRLKEAMELWDQAFEEAVHTNQSLKEAGINGETLVNGISEDGTTIVGENNLQMSERTYSDGGRAYLENWLKKKVKSRFISQADADDILSQTDAMYQIMQDIKNNNKLPDYARWAETDITTDENGKKVSVIVKNGDYAMNLDIALVCKKRTALNAVLNALVQSNDLSVYTLTETDVAELNAIIKEHEFEIACALCFVDSKRYRVGSWADSFCEGSEDKNGKKYGFNEMVRSLVPKGSDIKIDEFNFTNRNIVNQPTENLLKDADDSELDFTLIDKIMKDNPPAANGAKTAQYRYAEAIKNNKDLRSILNPSEIISSVGLDAIRVEHTGLYGLINGHQGTAKPKFAHQAVAFANDILRATSWNASRAKMVGGVRLQSFSDFMANMVFDYVQMVSEMAAKKLPAHAYTKEPLFVKLFGLTGLKINMSLVPKVDLTAEQIERFKNMTDAQKEADPEYKRMKETAGLRINENGEAEYVWEDETFPYDVAMDIMADGRYTKNCGTICVGISNAHIRKLLADDRISMVIPYHKSGLNHMVAEMRNIALYNDYTSVQNTRYASGEKLDTKKHKDFNFYSDLYGVGKKKGTHDPKQTAQNYLDWCEKRNYLPRFDEFRNDPNYYKLLIDFSVYDINDNMRYTEQEAVKAVYPSAEEFKDLILNGVQKNGVTYGGLKQSQGESTRLTNETRQIVDEFRNRLTEKYGQDVLGTQYSDRDSDGNHLTAEQQEYFKDSKVRDENGNLKVMYHGTERGAGFTVFNNEYSDDGRSFFFTDKLVTAKGYSGSYSTYSPKSFSSMDEVNAEIHKGVYNDGYHVEKEDGEYVLYYENDVLETSESLDEVYRVFQDGYGDELSATNYKVYLDLKNPLIVNADRNHWDELDKASKADKKVYDTLSAKVQPNGMFSYSYWDEHGKQISGEMTEQEFERTFGSKFFDEVVENDGEFNTVRERLVIDSASGKEVLSTTRQYAEYAKNNGYDGVIFNNIYDNAIYAAGSERFVDSTVVVAFDSNQIKSVANENPTENEDIRYSDRINSSEELSSYNLEGKWNDYIGVQKEVLNVLREEGFFDQGAITNQESGMIVRIATKGIRETLGKGNRFQTLPKRLKVYKVATLRSLPKLIETGYVIDDDVDNIHEEDGYKFAYIGNEVMIDGEPVRIRISVKKKVGANHFWIHNIDEYKNGSGLLGPSRKTENKETQSLTGSVAQADGDVNLNFSDRDGDLDSRTLLTNALSTVTQNDEEAYLLKEYREHIDLINIKENELSEITAQIKELSFGKGERDTKKLEYLKRRADKIRNSINYYDKKLLSLEAAGPLKSVVERERAKARKKAYEKNRDYTKQALSSYKERMEQKAKIQSITQKALTLNKWLLKNSKDEHIPEAVKPVVAKLLQAIDFSSKQLLGMSGANKGTPTKTDVSLAQALADVQQMMSKGEVDGDVLYELYGADLDAEMEKLVNDVNNYARTVGDNAYVLNQMTLDELKTLDNVVGAIKASVTKMNKFHVVNHNKGIADLSQQTIVDLNSLGQMKLHSGKLASGVSQMLNWGNATPYYAFKRFGEGGVKVYEALMDGWDRFAFNVKKIIDYAEDTYTSDEVTEWSEEVRTFKGIDGEIQMTVPQIMSLYCLQKREQAKGHILGGGIRVADIKSKKGVVSQSEGAVISESLLKDIISTLTDRQIAVADALQQFMNEDCAEWGNEISMERFGYKAFGEANYFPIRSDENITGDGEVKEKEKSLYRLLNMSFTKSVVKEANNRIVVENIFDVFAQHTSEMAKYNALALPVLDAVRWFNYKEKGEKENGRFKTYSLKQAMEKAFGRDANNYVNTFLEDINGSDNVGRDKLAKGFFSNAKIAAVGFNLKVAALQPTSYLRASAVIDPKYLANVSTPNNVKRGIEKAEKWCGMALWKSLGFYDTNIQRGVADLIKHEQSFKDKLTEASMKGAEMMDKFTFGCLWNACEAEVKDTRKNLVAGSDEYYTEVGKRLREVIYATQVVDSTMTRSHMMRSGDTMDKMLTSFASEPTLSYNMLMDVFYDWKLTERRYGKGEAFRRHKGKMVRVAAAYTVTNLVTSLLETAFEAYRDDDDEEEELSDYVVSFLQSFGSNMGISTKIPYVKDLISIIQGFTSSRTDTQWMQNLMYAFKDWVKIFNGKGNVYKAVYRTLSTVSQLSGAALGNAMRELASLWNLTIGSVYPSLKLYK